MAEYLGFEPSNEENYYFISYNRGDIDRIIPVLDELRKKGMQMWYDYGIPYDSKWEAVIAEKIDKSKSLFLFLSLDVLKKEDSFVIKEYRLAKSYEKNVYIICLDKIVIKDAPYGKGLWLEEILQRQCIMHQTPEQTAAELMRAVGMSGVDEQPHEAEMNLNGNDNTQKKVPHRNYDDRLIEWMEKAYECTKVCRETLKQGRNSEFVKAATDLHECIQEMYYWGERNGRKYPEMCAAIQHIIDSFNGFLQSYNEYAGSTDRTTKEAQMSVRKAEQLFNEIVQTLVNTLNDIA